MARSQVWYNDSTALPVRAGTYNVMVEIASSENFSAVKRMNIGSFTINKRTISLDTTALKVVDKICNGRDDDARISGLAFSNLPEGIGTERGHGLHALDTVRICRSWRGRDGYSYTLRIKITR